jgi:aspartate carbamoyltransferase catalytic subunit
MTTLPTLTEDPASWVGASLLSVRQISPLGLGLLFQVAQEMRTLVRTQGGDTRLAHRVLSTVFYEASTRTACSFQAAMMRLGGSHLHVDGAGGNSSAAKKGESLADTIRCLECYADVTVLRHPMQGSVATVVDQAAKAVVNAGDGVGEHPTQALLDVFTIYDELQLSSSSKRKQPQGPLVVVLLGDLKHGRTVHSLAKLLAASPQVWGSHQLILRYCAPPGLAMPSYICDFVAAQVRPDHIVVVQETVASLEEAVVGADVLYVTRVQKERFATEADYARVKGSYVVNQEVMKLCKSTMMLLHPLPRVDEIATNVDADPRAAYFRQMENGMFVRMALLALILGKRHA